jgi:hypothetical protein
MRFKHSAVGTCLTIFRSLALVLLSASFLTACNPGGSNTNHGVDKAGMSGGGATKDPGDGTGGATGDGGGGQGIQCGESKNPKISNRLFVRDIYEAISDQKLQVKDVPNDLSDTGTVSIEAIKILVASIKSYFGPASSNLSFTNEKFWNEFSAKISFIEDERELHASHDANSPIALPKECKVVQIAYWSDISGDTDNGTLYVSKNLWRDLDQLNKIALMAHEFFFKQARKSGFKNSDEVRSKVGKLLSTKGLNPLFDQWLPSKENRAKEILPESLNGFKYCEGISIEDPSAKIQFYQYEGKDKLQHFTIPLLSSGTINSSFLHGTSFTFDPKKEESLSIATDLLLYPPNLFDTIEKEGLYLSISTYQQWFVRWFEKIGTLWGVTTGSAQLLTYQFEIKNSSKLPEAVWTNYISSPLSPIQITLINPTFSTKAGADKILKKKKDLILTLNKKIKDTIRQCTKASDSDVDKVILVLNKSIRDAIQTGIYPVRYSDWIKSLQPLRPWKSNSPIYATDPCDNKKSSILEDYPNMLLNVHIDNYSVDRIYYILGDEGFYPQSFASTIIGKIRVSQNTDRLDFKLTCENYHDRYFKHFRSKQNVNERQLVENKHVNANVQKIDTTVSGAVSTDMDKMKSNIDLISKYLKLDGNAHAEFDSMLNRYDAVCVKESIFPFSNISCPHYLSFLEEFSSEKKINLTNCSTGLPVIESDQDDIRTSLCTIIKMATSNNSYKVYFNIREIPMLEMSFNPEIEFVRMIPTENHGE